MSHSLKKWTFHKPKDFKDQVKKLPPFVRQKLTEVMTLLSESDNPLTLGEKKKITKYGPLYAIRLNDNYRLSYDILDYENKIITIYRVGDHPFVYGK